MRSPARPGRCSQKGPTHDDPTRGADPAATGQAPVERQHRLIEELRRHRGRHATAEDLATALGVDVRTVERDITRLRDASPSPPAAAPAAASASTSPRRSPPVHLSPGEIAALVVSVTAVGP
jgi:predicted DNA-binding transcriptional regulator YafY